MSENKKNSLDARADQVCRLAHEVLGEMRVLIEVQSIRLSENFETNQAQIDAKLVEVIKGKPKKRTLKGEGVGLVDAFFDSMVKCYEESYCSLDAISIVDFVVDAHIDRGSKRKSDAYVTTLLRVKNSDDYEYAFKSTSTSVSHSSVSVVQETIAFFINAELAFASLHRALNDANERGRHDLVEKYQNQMATLVHATNYESLVKKLNEEL